MSGPLLYDFGGLVSSPGLLARNPASCIEVTNFRFPHTGIMRKRPGFALSANTAGVNEVFTSLMSIPEFGNDFYALGGGSGAPALYSGGGSGAWAALTDVGGSVYATATRNDGRLASLGGIKYVAARGVRRIDSTGYRVAGMPRGLPPYTYSMDAAVYSVLNGAGGFLADGSNVAYRVTYHFKSNGVELGGPPTSRLVIRNIAGTSGYAAATTQQVRLRIALPYELDSSSTLVPATFFWRLWRSPTMTTDTASDEMYLVAENFFTATDIANGYAVFTDLTPDSFLYGQTRLHTNSQNFPPLEAGTLNGQTYADEAPPLARDMAAWADCMWYATSFTRPAFNMRLISASFAAGNTVTINGQVCTAVAGAPVNPGDFTLVTTLATLSLNIEATARNLVDAYNRTSAVATVEAHLVSQGPDAGRIFLEANNNVASFAVVSATAGALFTPNITTSITTTATLPTNELRFSKPGRADAVPPVNSLFIGPSGAVIARIIPFRERLLVFTTAGLYQVDGTDFSNFTVSLVDETAQLFQRECIAISDDAVYAWCYSGIVEITDGGTRVVSDPIESIVQTISTTAINSSPSSTIFADGFAVASKRTHTVYFFYSPTASVANASAWLEFDTRSRKWSTGATTDGTGRSCGCIQQSTGSVVLALASTTPSAPSGVAKFFVERNDLAATDYRDDSTTGTPAAVVGTAKFQIQTPDPDGRAHWQQLLLHFEDGEKSWLTKPTGIGLAWYTDANGIVSGVSVAPDSPIVRVETPSLARRATRQQVTLTHALAENCGLVALNQSMRGRGSRFPK